MKYRWVAAALAVLVGSVGLAQTYRITNLGIFPDAGANDGTRAWGISPLGHVVGYGGTLDGNRPFLWDEVNGLQNLGTIPAYISAVVARAINSAGQVVGHGRTSLSPNLWRAFIWDSVNGMVEIGDLPGGDAFSGAFAINSTGQIVGYSYVAAGEHAFIWDSVNGMTDLGTLPGDTQSNAWSINDSGQVVGDSRGPDYDAFIWDSVNGMQPITGFPTEVDQTGAYGINSQGQVVGIMTVGPLPDKARAFLWDSSTGVQDLGILPGGGAYKYSATRINSSSVVIGNALVDSGTTRIWWVWDSENGMRDLNSLIDPPTPSWTLTEVTAINDAGQIVGMGKIGSVFRAFIATPVVEVLPDSFAIIRGFLTGGGLGDLFLSDDLRLDVRAGLTLFLGESPLQVTVTGSSPVEIPSELRFKLEASANTPGLIQTIELFNYVTSSYEQVDLAVPGFSDGIVEVVITTNPGRFVQAGTREMRAKVSYIQVGLTLLWPWSAKLDQAVWTIVP